MDFIKEKIMKETERVNKENREKIEEITSIQDDKSYDNHLYWFIKHLSEDKDGFPLKMPSIEVLTSLLKRSESDEEIINKNYQMFKRYNDSWEEQFLWIEEFIFENTIKQLKTGETKFRDFNISHFYYECGAESFEQKDAVKKALFTLTVKYPFFEARGETKYRLHNPKLYERAKALEKVAINPSIKYKVHTNPLFCLEDKYYFSKQDKLIVNFLTEAKKVAISPDMILIPFKYKKTYYYLTIDNLGETMILNTVNTGFTYINRQSNLYYQISANITAELRTDYNEFEHHFIKSMRKAMGINTKILRKVYNKPIRFIESKYIDFNENET